MRQTTRHRLAGVLAVAAIALCGVLTCLLVGGIYAYGSVVFLLLLAKAVLALASTAASAPTADDRGALDRLRVGVAIPIYNEDPAMLAACLDSVLAQRRPVQSVVVVDDCSSDPAALSLADSYTDRFAAVGIHLRTERHTVNVGKREGLIDALDAQPDIDLLLCVDSDTVLAPDALDEALKPYSDPEVTVVTGLVLALNHRQNLLTRLTDLRYANAFLFERAAYSSLGSVLCACGSLAVYRADIMRKYRDDFLTQEFLGQPAVFGDDRRQTNYGLLEGKAVFQPTAVAETLVPARLRHYIRQQIRWSKSFFRESLWAMRHLPKRQPGAWLSAVEVVTWLLMTGALAFALVRPLIPGVAAGPQEYLAYGVCLTLFAYARSIFCFDVPRAHRSRRRQAGSFLLAPLYALLHVGLLIWLRCVALCTLRRASWGTRATVEVTFDQASTALAA